MLATFWLTVLCFSLPALISLAFLARGGRFTSVPLWIGMQIGFFVILSCLLRGLPYGATKLIAVTTLATLFTLAVGTFLEKKELTRRSSLLKISPWWLGVCAVAALVAVFDHAFIVGSQGWSWDPGKMFFLKTSYFRGPFNTDAQRNVIVTNALIRGGSSPFLPDGVFSYQLAWFYAAAVLVAPFRAITNYAYVSGVTLGLSAIFFFTLAWAILVVRPTLMRRPILFLMLMALIGFHADIVSGIASLVQFGRPGMEADGSVDWVFFRNFSLKLTALLSPHHLLFLYFVCLQWAGHRILKGRLGEGSLAVVASVVSPMLATFFYPIKWGYRLLMQRDVRIFGHALIVLASTTILFFLCLGFPIWDLFLREVASEIRVFPIRTLIETGKVAWLGIPFLWASSLGAIGILATIMFLFPGARRRFDFWGIFLVLGNLGVYYIVTGIELQRHFVILSSLVVLFWIVPRFSLRSRPAQAGFILLFAVSYLFHAYFILAFTQKENLIDARLPWHDYFKMNEWLEEHPEIPSVLSASPYIYNGYPISMEVRTGFSVPFDVFIYNKIPKETLSTLYRVHAQQLVVPYGLALGYSHILWGPFEERAWGPRAKSRFIRESNRIATVGAVSVYRLEDFLWEEAPAKRLASREWRADRLYEEGWLQEAFDEYLSVLSQNGSNTHAKARIEALFRVRVGGRSGGGG